MEKSSELALEGVIGARLEQGLQELGDLDEAHPVAGATRAVSEGLAESS